MQLSGLGAYPEDAYFDPERPDWLPYWIDTPNESDMKWHTTLPEVGGYIGQVAGGAANMIGEVAGGIAGGAASGLSRSVNISGLLVLGLAAYVAVAVLPGILAARH